MDQYITTSMVYTQLKKKFMDDRLNLGSIRYDKAQNYDECIRLECLLYILVKVGDITEGIISNRF
jgi:hypothetical protein